MSGGKADIAGHDPYVRDWMRGDVRYERALDEAARDRDERDDPDTNRIVDARDLAAASGRFDEADSTQRLIDSIRATSGDRFCADAERLSGRGQEPMHDHTRYHNEPYPEITRGKGAQR